MLKTHFRTDFCPIKQKTFITLTFCILFKAIASLSAEVTEATMFTLTAVSYNYSHFMPTLCYLFWKTDFFCFRVFCSTTKNGPMHCGSWRFQATHLKGPCTRNKWVQLILYKNTLLGNSKHVVNSTTNL